MKLEDFLEFICQKLEMPVPSIGPDNTYIINHSKDATVSLSTTGENILLQANLGPQLKDSEASQNALLLSEILQFNLKRMRVLDESLSLNPETKQLCLRKEISLNKLTAENTWDIFDDFLTNVAVIEKRFFNNNSYA